MSFQSEHKLDFEVAKWIMGPYMRFRIGTCHGLWGVTKTSYDILVIKNDVKGNGHLDDMFQWFENSCKRDNRDLKILEIWNSKFKTHLINKRGFKLIDEFTAIKIFF